MLAGWRLFLYVISGNHGLSLLLLCTLFVKFPFTGHCSHLLLCTVPPLCTPSMHGGFFLFSPYSPVPLASLGWFPSAPSLLPHFYPTLYLPFFGYPTIPNFAYYYLPISNILQIIWVYALFYTINLETKGESSYYLFLHGTLCCLVMPLLGCLLSSRGDATFTP